MILINRTYYHNVDRKICISADLPTTKHIINLMAQQLPNPIKVVLDVGVAYCHPEDQYKKSTGRDVANMKMLPVAYKLTCTYTKKSGTELYLTNKEDNSTITLLLKPGYIFPHLVDAYIPRTAIKTFDDLTKELRARENVYNKL